MPTILGEDIVQSLRQTIADPCLARARELEVALLRADLQRHVLGRINQKSSIEANAESDRGIAERLSNALDATLKAARYAVDMRETNKTMSPRSVIRQLLNPQTDQCAWEPQDTRITSQSPVIQFWRESDDENLRFKKYNPKDGLVSVMIRDYGIGLEREEMAKTILDLNSAAKLKDFDAIGQFGHGGSSALNFCESCLIVSMPRFASTGDEFYWTLVFQEREEEESKQDILRKWFADQDGYPLVCRQGEVPELAGLLPGVTVWHFGYAKGGWIKPIAGPEQTNPWGRLGRLFFSYPLPFRVQGEFARTDTATGTRTITGALFRLTGGDEDRSGSDQTKLLHRTSGKRETLIVDGQSYGEFAIDVLVLQNQSSVRDYVDSQRPVVLTLHGQNHGEMTRRIMEHASLPELASRSIVEVRLEDLDAEAQGEIIRNSRDLPKDTVFTRELEDRLIRLMASDEALRALELRLQEDKARQSSAGLSRRMKDFLSKILSDAAAEPDVRAGGESPGGKGTRGEARPEIQPTDPPQLLEFLFDTPLLVPEGTKRLAKFKSDARPPKYSFFGENPRCFATLLVGNSDAGRLTIVGKSDIDNLGYGSITIYCEEIPDDLVTEEREVGLLRVWMQCSDGRSLQHDLKVGIAPKPQVTEKKRTPSVEPEIIFVAPDGEDERSRLATLLSEDRVSAFEECTHLKHHCELLNLDPCNTTYWGSRVDRGGQSVLQVEINAGNPDLKRLLSTCRTAEEQVETKERYVRDVLLDCYQHLFKIEELPQGIVQKRDQDETQRAVDIHLNHDKAIRIARHERDKRR